MSTVAETSSPSLDRESERSVRTAALLLEAEQCADPSRRQELHDEVVLLNLEVADALASRYARRGLDLEDLTQVARLALVRVVPQFRSEFGRDFLAYAVPSILGTLRRQFRDTGWVVRPPRRLQEAQAVLNTARPALAQRLGRQPTIAELAEETGIEEETLLESADLAECFTPRSLDAPLGRNDSGADLADLLGAPDAAFARSEARIVLTPLMAELSPRDRLVLDLRYVEGLTQREIGEQIGISQMQVSRVLSRVLAELRSGLEEPAQTPVLAVAG